MTLARELIRIAGITLRLHYADAGLHRSWSTAVSRFAVDSDDGDDNFDITVEEMPDHLDAPAGLLFDSGAVWSAYSTTDGLRIDCHSDTLGPAPYKVAFFSRDFRQGRILVRPSGTEPLIRVMVEAATHSLAQTTAEGLAAQVLARFG